MKRLLILTRGDGQYIAAEATSIGDQVMVRNNEAARFAVPQSIVNYVARTHEFVILDDVAGQSRFVGGTYFSQHHVRSILCLPLITQGKLVAIIYLENSLASHVFTSQRISVLKILVAQVAISLENMQLYVDLRQREAKIRRLVEHDERALAEIRATGTVQPYEKELFRKDGSRVPVLVAGTLFEEGGREGVAFALDLSEQEAGAAVTNAEACLQLIDREQADVPEAREAALAMVKDASRAADVIDRVRSLYQRGSAHMEAVEVNEIIHEMIGMLHNEADRHSVTMRINLTEELPRVIADRAQLQQVLMNLALNGIEAMGVDTAGELSIKSQLAENNRPLISVTDTGVGLPNGMTDRIFDAFFTTKPQGTGLGLAIALSIVESHGGRIWATANSSGRGATFCFALPVQSHGLGKLSRGQRILHCT